MGAGFRGGGVQFSRRNIGNAPNFMVKSIAERHDVETPSFGGYIAYSGLILTPLFLIVTFVFFRG